MQVVIPVNQSVPVINQGSSDVPEHSYVATQEIRDGTPEWKSIVRVILIVALIAAVIYVGRIVVPKVIQFLTKAGEAGATVVESASTVVESVATTVEQVADSTALVVESIGTGAQAAAQGVAHFNTAVGGTIGKIADSAASTVEFIGEALTRPLPVVLIEQYVEHAPPLVTSLPTEPEKFIRFNNFMNFINKIF